MLTTDYIRNASLELCAEEIIKNKLHGNVAEVGVFQGEFAKKINIVFPDKKLYLFDTFEGFHQNDIDIEQQKNFSKGDQDFSNTSIQMVKSKMTYPQQCIFKKGYFPETAKDIDDEFCFVSLDTDLYKPIYDGLCFFYPRLVKNGYIFIHDFNNEIYAGAREAVVQFCKEQGIHYTPIPDIGGSAIITK